jgi:hypothetical protein
LSKTFTGKKKKKNNLERRAGHSVSLEMKISTNRVDVVVAVAVLVVVHPEGAAHLDVVRPRVEAAAVVLQGDVLVVVHPEGAVAPQGDVDHLDVVAGHPNAVAPQGDGQPEGVAGHLVDVGGVVRK